MNTKIRISFKSKNQTPELMIVKELYDSSKIVHASVIYQENIPGNVSDIVFDNEEIVLVKEIRLERVGEIK